MKNCHLYLLVAPIIYGGLYNEVIGICISNAARTNSFSSILGFLDVKVHTFLQACHDLSLSWFSS